MFPNFNGATLRFENGYVILSHTLLGMWLLIHAAIKVIQCHSQTWEFPAIKTVHQGSDFELRTVHDR